MNYLTHTSCNIIVEKTNEAHRVEQFRKGLIRNYLMSTETPLQAARAIFSKLPKGYLGVGDFSGHERLARYSPSKNLRIAQKDLSIYDDFYFDRHVTFDPLDLLRDALANLYYYLDKGDEYSIRTEQRKVDLARFLVDVAISKGVSQLTYDW